MSNVSDFHYGHFRSESALETGVLLFDIVLPILLVLGTVGNILSIIVLSRPSMKKIGINYILTGFGICRFVGTVCVSTARLDEIYYRRHKECVHLDLQNIFLATVRIFGLFHLDLDITNRREADFHASTIICKNWHAKRIILYLLVVDLIVNCHFLFGMELRQEHRDGIYVYACGPVSDGYEQFFKYAWHYIDLALFSLIPFFILLVSNIYIIYKLVTKKKKLTTSSPAMMTSHAAQTTSSMAKLLVALNIIFIISTAPIDIYLISKPYIIPDDIPTAVEDKDPWYAFVKILMYINNSVNFILYIANGSKFRTKLKKIFQILFNRYQSSEFSSQTHPRSTINTPSHSVIERVTYIHKQRCLIVQFDFRTDCLIMCLCSFRVMTTLYLLRENKGIRR